jgi:hypothetical protein
MIPSLALPSKLLCRADVKSHWKHSDDYGCLCGADMC